MKQRTALEFRSRANGYRTWVTVYDDEVAATIADFDGVGYDLSDVEELA